MMEFKQAIRIWKRMCESNGRCARCPIPVHGGTSCPTWVMRNPDEAEAILAIWAEEHPEKTIADDFFAKHPKASRADNGCPTTCARRLGYVCECLVAEGKASDCVACWRRPLEEVEG